MTRTKVGALSIFRSSTEAVCHRAYLCRAYASIAIAHCLDVPNVCYWGVSEPYLAREKEESTQDYVRKVVTEIKNMGN